MVNRIKTAAFSLATMALISPVAAQETVDVSTIVATVNGKDFTVGHMILMLDDLPDQFKQYPSEILFDALYQQLVEQSLLAGTVTGELSARVRYGTDNAHRDLLSVSVIEEIYSEAATEEAIQAAYQTEWLDADLGTEYNASHILVDTQEEAAALLIGLQAGLDFAEVAKEHSTGPSGPSGGSLNWFQRGDMVPPFDAAVAEMQVGEIAGPVETQFGWHLIKLNDTRAIEPLELDIVREELADSLGSKALDKAIADLKAGAVIERKVPEDFDPSILKDLSLLEK